MQKLSAGQTALQDIPCPSPETNAEENPEPPTAPGRSGKPPGGTDEVKAKPKPKAKGKKEKPPATWHQSFLSSNKS